MEPQFWRKEQKRPTTSCWDTCIFRRVCSLLLGDFGSEIVWRWTTWPPHTSTSTPNFHGPTASYISHKLLTFSEQYKQRDALLRFYVDIGIDRVQQQSDCSYEQRPRTEVPAVTGRINLLLPLTKCRQRAQIKICNAPAKPSRAGPLNTWFVDRFQSLNFYGVSGAANAAAIFGYCYKYPDVISRRPRQIYISRFFNSSSG